MNMSTSGLTARSAYGRRSPADPCHTTVRTGPYTAVRDGYASIPRIRTECGLGFRFQSSPRTAQPLPFPPLGLHPSAEEKSSSMWVFCCLSSLRLMAYWPLLLVRAFGHRFRLGLSLLRLSAFGVPH